MLMQDEEACLAFLISRGGPAGPKDSNWQRDSEICFYPLTQSWMRNLPSAHLPHAVITEQTSGVRPSLQHLGLAHTDSFDKSYKNQWLF